MFVIDTDDSVTPYVRDVVDIAGEIATLKQGLAASLACTTALETARTILETYASEQGIPPILSAISYGEKQKDREVHDLCEKIFILQKEMHSIWQ